MRPGAHPDQSMDQVEELHEACGETSRLHQDHGVQDCRQRVQGIQGAGQAAAADQDGDYRDLAECRQGHAAVAVQPLVEADGPESDCVQGMYVDIANLCKCIKKNVACKLLYGVRKIVLNTWNVECNAREWSVHPLWPAASWQKEPPGEVQMCLGGMLHEMLISPCNPTEKPTNRNCKYSEPLSRTL